MGTMGTVGRRLGGVACTCRSSNVSKAQTGTAQNQEALLEINSRWWGRLQIKVMKRQKGCSENESQHAESWPLYMNWFNAVEAPARDESRCEVCPLSRVQAGVAVRIKQLCAAPEMQNRLRELGFCEDQIIKLLTSKNNYICQVCNARLAISEQLARIILVEPLRPALAR